MRKKQCLSLLILVFLGLSSPVSANSDVLVDTGRIQVFSTKEMVYYGLDFSNFTYVNYEKMLPGEYLKDVDNFRFIKYGNLELAAKLKNEYIPVWFEKFEEQYPEKRMKQLLGVDLLNYNIVSFQNDQLRKTNGEELVSAEPNDLTVEGLRKVVLDYNLAEKSGIGLSIVVKDFIKKTESVICYITFFDIETRKILFVSEELGIAAGWGIEYYWRQGLIDLWYEFCIRDYMLEKKSVKKELKKINKRK